MNERALTKHSFPMAKKKKADKAAPVKRRQRRTPEQIIADLQQQIQEVKARAAAKELKQSPAIKKGLAAVRAVDKALELAEAEGNGKLRHALADARRAMADYLVGEGLRLPKARLPRGRRPK